MFSEENQERGGNNIIIYETFSDGMRNREEAGFDPNVII